MNGRVDDCGRALLSVSLRATEDAAAEELEAWIDTGFSGDLVMPRSQIDEREFARSGTTVALLADGSEVQLPTFGCLVDWFGQLQYLEVIANDGEIPLLGVGLLLGRDLHVSYRSGDVSIS